MARNAAASFFYLFVFVLGAFAYNPPIGIPDPKTTWGALDAIDTPNPTASTYAPGWFAGTPRENSVARGDAHDCYYIDNSAVGATDTSNTYGYPGKPRLTIPAIVYLAGSYVEIHGDGATGAYYYTASMNPRGTGTDKAPIWFVGVNKPLLSGKLDLGASNYVRDSYMIFDGLRWANGGQIDIRPRFTGNSIDHICVRNCDLNGGGRKNSGSGLTVGQSSPTDATQTTQDVVIYNCDVYAYGDKENPNEECGIYPHAYVTRMWALDSRVHDVAEDGFGGSHGGQRTSSYYYIGRNQIYNNLTNATDLKGIGKVVISENNMYGTHEVWEGGVQKSSSIGETNVFHYGGASSGAGSWNAFPEDISFLFNTVQGGRFGIRTSRCGQLRIVGNVFYGAHEEAVKHGTSQPYEIQFSGIRGDTWVVNNTFYDFDGGIEIQDIPSAYNAATTYYRADVASYNGLTYLCTNDNSDAGIKGVSPSDTGHWRTYRVQIWGNVVMNRTVSTQAEISLDSTTFAANSVDLDYNDVHNDTYGEGYLYGNTLRDLAWIKANTAAERHSINADPLLTRPSSDFTLQSGSPAIDSSTKGTGTTAYDDFFSTYGIAIEVDRSGVKRPFGEGWDIGAYEFDGSDSGIPSPPQNFRVLPQ